MLRSIVRGLAALVFALAAVVPAPAYIIGSRQVSHPGYLASSFYATFTGFASTTSAVPAIDTVYIYPFVITSNVTVASLSVRVVTGGAGSSVKLAIYGTGSTGKPSGAPLAANNTGAATTSNSTTVTLSAAVTLTPGVYWVAQKYTGTLPTTVSINSLSYSFDGLLGRATIGSSALTAWSKADTYSNDMPTLTGSDSWTDVVAGGVGVVFLGT